MFRNCDVASGIKSKLLFASHEIWTFIYRPWNKKLESDKFIWQRPIYFVSLDRLGGVRRARGMLARQLNIFDAVLSPSIKTFGVEEPTQQSDYLECVFFGSTNIQSVLLGSAQTIELHVGRFFLAKTRRMSVQICKRFFFASLVLKSERIAE